MSQFPSSSGPIPSTTISTPPPPAPPSKSSKPPDTRCESLKPTSAAAALSTTSACSTAPNPCSSTSSTQLEPEIEAGIPIVGLEPSCVAVFRDELLNLFPHDQRAQALSQQTFLLSEFLERELDHNSRNAPLPQFTRKALLHGHCHHKSIMKMTAEESLLHRLGIDFQSPAPGCCGMAGSFGFEHDKYDISQAIGELELLPAVRKAPPDWLIIADGFSCREQIAQAPAATPCTLPKSCKWRSMLPLCLVIPTEAGAQATE